MMNHNFFFFFGAIIALIIPSCSSICQDNPIRVGDFEWRNPYNLHIAEVVNLNEHDRDLQYSGSPSFLRLCDAPDSIQNVNYDIQISIWHTEENPKNVDLIIQEVMRGTKKTLQRTSYSVDQLEPFEKSDGYYAKGYKFYFNLGEGLCGAVYCFHVENELMKVMIFSISRGAQDPVSEKKTLLGITEETALSFHRISAMEKNFNQYLITRSKDGRMEYYHSKEGRLLMVDSEEKRTYDLSEELSKYFFSFPNYAIVGDVLFIEGGNGANGAFYAENLCKIDLSTGALTHVLRAYNIVFTHGFSATITDRTLVKMGEGYWDSDWKTEERTVSLLQL